MSESRTAKHPLGIECRLCHRIGWRGYVPAGGDNDTWECSNDCACRRRQPIDLLAALQRSLTASDRGAPQPGEATG